MAGPLSPPLSRPSRDSSDRPALRFAPAWHLKQFSARTGRTFASKNSTSSRVGSDAAAGTAATTRSRTTRVRYGFRMAGDWLRGGNAVGGRSGLLNLQAAHVLRLLGEVLLAQADGAVDLGAGELAAGH